MIRAWLVVAILLVPMPCLAQVSADFDLSWHKIASGGTTTATGGAFQLAATVAQVDASPRATSAGGEYRLTGGFWPLNSSALLVSVPDPSPSTAPARFDLLGFGQNPETTGARLVRFSLAVRGATRLEMLDVGGRRVFLESWDDLDPGEHAINLGSGLHLAPGIYWLRLTQGASSMSRKVVLMNQ